MSLLTIKPLTPAELPAFRDLLGGADFGGCFCAVWHAFDESWVQRCQDPAQPNYAVTEKRVRAGQHAGYFIHEGPELIGWTGSGPKSDFPLLKEKLASRLTPVSPDIWSIGCLSIREKFRGHGYADRAVESLSALAITRGARWLEAYPVRPTHEPRLYRGTERLYERQGFAVAGVEKDGAHEVLLMRRELKPGPRAGA